MAKTAKKKISIRTMKLESEYKPSPQAWNFHISPARFRYVIWGIKGGKSYSGAVELCRMALGMPGSLCWVVAPTYQHLQVAETEVLNILNQFEGLIHHRNKTKRDITLIHGGKICFRSADWPDTLRGPNLDVIWIDEGAFMKPEAWWILYDRVAATMGEIFVTTTPRGRNWLWAEAIKSGMPADMPYGEFSDGDRWISHYPTWQFEWVPESHIRDARMSKPAEIYEQEYGALFITESSQVFRRIEESVHMIPQHKDKTKYGPTSIGVDLAKYQDFTAIVVMDGTGAAIHVDHWNETDWSIQEARLIQLAEDYNGTLILDRSNVGSVMEERLRKAKVRVEPVDMNDARVKEALIQGLQVAFEHSMIKIPDYTWEFSPRAAITLYNELKTYEYSLTRGGRLSYGAPRGLHDDLVIALSLALAGKNKGHAGAIQSSSGVMVPRRKWNGKNPQLNGVRPKTFGRTFRGRKSSIGLRGPSGRFWEG